MSNSQYATARYLDTLFPKEQVQLSGGFTRAIRKGFALLYAWQDRANERAHLAAMEDHLLIDMGISRAQAEREAAKPFWRP